MNQNRSIRDFFTAVSNPKVKPAHDRDDASDSDEIVVASRTTTPAKTQASKRKTKKDVKPQSSTTKSRSHSTSARGVNEGPLVYDDNIRPMKVSGHTSSTPNRPRAIGQPSSGIPVSGSVQSPVKLPLRSPRSASSSGQTAHSEHRTLDRDRLSHIVTSKSELSGGTRKGDHGQLLGKRVLTAVSIPPLALENDGSEEDRARQSSSPHTASGSPIDPMELETVSFSSTLEASRGLISTQSSSRRVVKNGLQVVTNSDSEDGGNSSDEGLGDVSIFIPYKRRRSSRPDENLTPRRSDRLSKSARKNSRPAEVEAAGPRRRLPPVPPPRTVYRHNLANMVAQMQKSRQVEARITSLENEIAEVKPMGQKEDPGLEADELDPQALVDAADCDSDERERMLQALSRAEALKEKEGYHFFLDHIPLYATSPFPRIPLDDGIWHHILADDQLRAQAFISGFIMDMVARHPLPMEVTLWMAQQLTHERRDILCEAYVEILHLSLQHATSVSDTMGRLSCFYKTRSFSESLMRDVGSPKLPHGISHLVRVVSSIAPASDARITNASPSDTSAAILDFACMLIDMRVLGDPSLSMTIMQSAEDMLEALSRDSFEMLESEVTKTLFEADDMSPRDRYHLITSFPVGTRRACRLRRSFALACFTASTTQVKPPDQKDWAKIIITAFQTRPEFAISESTDYDLLRALIEVLDIAIGPGFLDLSRSLPTHTQSGPNLSAPFGGTPAAETLHNKQVDALALHLQAMASRIRDAGANYLPRTEAKTAIERVVLRLEYSVRTQPKPRKSVFGAGSATQNGLNGFFSTVDRGMKAVCE